MTVMFRAVTAVEAAMEVPGSLDGEGNVQLLACHDWVAAGHSHQRKCGQHLGCEVLDPTERLLP